MLSRIRQLLIIGLELRLDELKNSKRTEDEVEENNIFTGSTALSHDYLDTHTQEGKLERHG